MIFIYLSITVSVVALLFAVVLAFCVKRQKIENERAKQVSKIIRRGAITFLNKQYKVLFVSVFIIAVLLFVFVDNNIAFSFLIGSFLSALAGNIGMRMAVFGNIRTAEKANHGLRKAMKVAFSSGVVVSKIVVGFGLLGIGVVYLIFRDPYIVYGFGFGASVVAFFARVGGGIYTKAADIGADLTGKIETGISEDDLRNPASVADNVGDNVGDVAGMGADLFESYVDAIIAAMVIGSTGLLIGMGNLILLPLVLAAVGIVSSILGVVLVWVLKTKDPTKSFNFGVLGASASTIIISIFTIKIITGSFKLFLPFVVGLLAGIGIGLITEFFTSYNFKPTKKVAISAQTNSAMNILNGFALGMKSVLFPVLIIVTAIFLSYFFGGIYGIAIAAVGMLSTLGITLAIDAYGPVVDNAAGIVEMAEMGPEAKKITKKMDAIGNTTAAIGKGFAIGAAALTSVVLLINYSLIADLAIINLLKINTIIGLFIGGLVPFLFSSFSIASVNKIAIKLIQEVRSQFKKNKKILTEKIKPDYNRCIVIGTTSALKEMVLPGILVIFIPVLVGFLLGAEALGGFLVSSIIVGFLLAVMMANSGASWDNAKKYIELGNLGGEKSEPHKASIIGDMVGDPFKDAAGPSLNILLKLMAIVALIIAPLL